MTSSNTGRGEGDCNCPPLRDVFDGVMGTKPPCPVHDTPERLEALKDILIPAQPLGDLSFPPLTSAVEPASVELPDRPEAGRHG